jgi:hypothetical protein
MVFHLTSYIVKTFHQTGVLCFLRKEYAAKSQVVSGVRTQLAISLDVMYPTVIHISIVAPQTILVNMARFQCQ